MDDHFLKMKISFLKGFKIQRQISNRAFRPFESYLRSPVWRTARAIAESLYLFLRAKVTSRLVAGSGNYCHAARAGLSLALLFLLLLESHAAESQSESPWDVSGAVSIGVGYKDNILLSPVQKEDGAFLASGFDLFILHLPVNQTEFHFFLSASENRFFQADSLDKEQTILALAEFSHPLAGKFKAGYSVQYSYLDQVLDVSSSEATLSALQVKAHILGFKPGFRYEFSADQYLELELPAGRDIYDKPLDSYWEAGGRLNFQTGPRRNRLKLGVEWTRRLYDSRLPTDLTGNPSGIRTLRFDRQMADASYAKSFGSENRWHWTSKLGVLRNHDNGSEFFDYLRPFAGQELRLKTAKWEAKAGGKVNFYFYDHQYSALGRRREEIVFSGSFRVERKLTERLKVFLLAEHDRSDSDLTLDSYQANTISSGLNWDF